MFYIVRVQAPSGVARSVVVLASSESRACREACRVAAESFPEIATAGWLPISALQR